MTKNISIDNSLKDILPDFNIGILKFSLNNFKANVDELIENIENEIQNKYNLEDVLKIEGIKIARDSYKKLRKDPSRYRLAVESLFRRIVKGNKLYRINSIVDFGNYLSLKFTKSIAVLDYDKINGDILIRKGNSEDHFVGIGRGEIDISNIPVYTDKIGPFGSTTSDHERTKITNNTKGILLFIISFQGKDVLVEDMNQTVGLLKKYFLIDDEIYQEII